jgi:hypothetical protein
MAEYGGNSLAVQFQRNIVDEPLPANQSQALPAHTPQQGWFMPGQKLKPTAPIRNLPWKSWLGPKRPHSKRAKRRSSLGSLMGR